MKQHEYKEFLENELAKLNEKETAEAIIRTWEARVTSWNKGYERVALLPCFEVHELVTLARKLQTKLDSK